MDKETVTLSRKEQKRAMVLGKVDRREMTAGEAAQVLGMTLRHVRRLLAGYRRDGPGALAHGNRGRKPAHTLDPSVRLRVIELAEGRYKGFNHQHMTEKIQKELKVSRSSVRRILVGSGIKSPRTRRAPKHRSRRERMPQEGMLVQVDGSRHDWLEGRGPYLSLILSVDDATGTVPHALFREQEDGQGYFLLLKEIIGRKGLPLALYTDKHSIFRPSHGEKESLEEELMGKRKLTQFGRALEELAIEDIFADSPQAKGRVERLGGTFQDRLVSELRLAGAKTIEEANHLLGSFLPDYNEQFGVPAAKAGTAYRQLDGGLCLDGVLCFKHRRKVANDNTIRLGERVLQLQPGPGRLSYAQAQVEVQERLDGSLVVVYQDRVIGTHQAPPGPVKLRAQKLRKNGEVNHAEKIALVVGVRPDEEASTLEDANARENQAGPHSNGEYHPTAKQRPLPPLPGPDHPWRRWVVTKSQNT